MYDAVCTLPLTADLFAQAISPREPFLAVGLASGHVQCFKLPPESTVGASNDNGHDKQGTNGKVIAVGNGHGLVESAWRTRRHKGSCRTLWFSTDGEKLMSAGTDGIVKVALSETGRVEGKIAVPKDPFSATGAIDAPTLLHILTPQNLMLTTDSGALHLYDLRSKDSSFASSKPSQTHHPHDDYVSSLTPLPASAASTSGFPKQVVTTGGTTLAVTDIRRGVLAKSEDQDEELLSSCFVSGLNSRGTNVGEKLVVGGASGALSLWERGVWDDIDERIVLDKGPGGGESVDTLVSLPDDVTLSEGGKGVVAGMGNGMLVFSTVGGQNGIVDILRHDEAEGVVGLGFDVARRMISGGGQTVKVWHEVGDIEVDEEDEEEGEVEEINGKRAGSEDNESWEGEESGEDEKLKKKRKRGRRFAGVNGTRFSFQGLD